MCRGIRTGECDGMPRAPRRWRRCRPPRGRVWWKAVSNTATCGTSGKAFRAATMPARFAGLCSGARTDSSSMLISTRAVMSVGAKKRAPPWTTRWPDGDRRVLLQRRPVRREGVEHHLEPGGVVGDRLLERRGGLEHRRCRAVGLRRVDRVAGHPDRFADALDETGGEHALGVHVDELVLERRGAAVHDEHSTHLDVPLSAEGVGVLCGEWDMITRPGPAPGPGWR